MSDLFGLLEMTATLKFTYSEAINITDSTPTIIGYHTEKVPASIGIGLIILSVLKSFDSNFNFGSESNSWSIQDKYFLRRKDG